MRVDHLSSNNRHSLAHTTHYNYKHALHTHYDILYCENTIDICGLDYRMMDNNVDHYFSIQYAYDVRILQKLLSSSYKTSINSSLVGVAFCLDGVSLYECRS